MKSFLILTLLTLSFSFSFAQTTPVVATPVVTSAPGTQVTVSEPAAPPKWAEDVIVSAQSLPVVGPFVSKALMYLGIISSILTALIAFLLTALNALSGVFNVAGLVEASAKIQLFKDGKIMYWLKYLSMFNAKKPEVPASADAEKVSAA